MAPWEWIVLTGLLLLVLTQLFARLTGRPGFSVPDWLDVPPYFPGRR
jgi:hypothetical protein